MKILILGVSGMLGHTLFFYLNRKKENEIYATIRNKEEINRFFPSDFYKKIISDINVFNIKTVKDIIKNIKPELVINCIGIIKQLKEAKNSKISITINSLFPHQLAEICEENNSRLIHISTDCVFSGKKGNYKENDYADADDLYGRTKYLGEVDYPNSVTLRTSIIGHELKHGVSLVDWFLAQKGNVNGYTNAIYTGFPTIEFAEIIDKYVITNPDLKGIYHVSSKPVSKYDLLQQVKKIYKKDITIIPYTDFRIDRSLDSSKFNSATGYRTPSWEELVLKMYNNYLENRSLYKNSDKIEKDR